MGLVETEGLILKSYSLAEADKIIVFLTENEGLVRGVAKGAKRLKSRFGGSLEPFSVVQVTYFQKEDRELVSISNIELINSFFKQASDINFLGKFAYLVDLLTEFAPPHDPNERLYRMAKICFKTASEDAESLESIVFYFQLWLLRLGGYLPDWSKCDVCGEKLSSANNAYLVSNFHIVCGQCQKSRNNLIVTPEQRNLFETAQKLSPSKFADLNKNRTQDLKEMSSILRRIISNIIGKETASEKILTASL
jgi:DNA repair protein RecO (recombination protein O)